MTAHLELLHHPPEGLSEPAHALFLEAVAAQQSAVDHIGPDLSDSWRNTLTVLGSTKARTVRLLATKLAEQAPLVDDLGRSTELWTENIYHAAAA